MDRIVLAACRACCCAGPEKTKKGRQHYFAIKLVWFLCEDKDNFFIYVIIKRTARKKDEKLQKLYTIIASHSKTYTVMRVM